jgi:Phage integrase family
MSRLTVDVVPVAIRTDNTGVVLRLPTVMTEEGVMPELVKYQVLHSGAKSLTWQRALCRAVRLLLEYANANAGCFSSPQECFQSFAIALRSGTQKQRQDPSNLYWESMGRGAARHTISLLTNFSRHLVEKGYAKDELNPPREATRPEQIVAALAWAHKNNASFLGHIESETEARRLAKQHDYLPNERGLVIKGKQNPRFPEDRFFDLIFEGFAMHRGVKNPVQRLDLRGALITLLMHGGGIRLSEAFHIWMRDIEPDPLDLFQMHKVLPRLNENEPELPPRALVRIHHPSDGFYTWKTQSGDTVTKKRRVYLDEIGYSPRDKVMGGLHAGWKNPTLDGENYLQVFWSDPAYGILFLQLWRRYTQQVRSFSGSPPHPWAWLNLERRKLEPYTYESYEQAHKRAVERIGLVHLKPFGTTPHGHRHAYMYRLREASVPEIVIQRVAHHHSIESQKVYTQVEIGESRAAIAASFARLKDLEKVNLQVFHKRFATVVGEPLTLK